MTMVNLGDVVTVVSVLIAIGSLVVAVVVATRNKSKDTKQETKEAVEIHAGLQSQIDVLKTSLDMQLSSIDSGVRDLRADNRGFRSELTKLRDDLRDEMREIHDEAAHAVELAEAAHRRLDRMGAPEDASVKKLKEKE